MTDGAEGPYIMWIDYGLEGWSPQSFQTLREAVCVRPIGGDCVITHIIEREVIQIEIQR
jgi:hypothetical protein